MVIIEFVAVTVSAIVIVISVALICKETKVSTEKNLWEVIDDQ